MGGSPSETTGTNWIIAATLERGGVQWDAATEYSFGDLIYEDGIYYKRIGTDPTDPEQPSLTAANWERAICPCGYIVESNTTFAPDFKNNNFFDYTMTADTDFSEPSIIEPGVTGTIVVRQDDIGGHTATWSFHYLFPAGLPVLDPSAGWIHIFEYKCISATEVVMEFVSSLRKDSGTAVPTKIMDFDATDGELHQITFTWSPA